ncbi:MAG: hypothetical protein R3Y28_02955 [Candidatus Gastranaerophilales bacterium]
MNIDSNTSSSTATLTKNTNNTSKNSETNNKNNQTSFEAELQNFDNSKTNIDNETSARSEETRNENNTENKNIQNAINNETFNKETITNKNNSENKNVKNSLNNEILNSLNANINEIESSLVNSELDTTLYTDMSENNSVLNSNYINNTNIINTEDILSENIKELTNVQDLMSNAKNNVVSSLSDYATMESAFSYDSNSMQMSDGDALFFADMIKNNEGITTQSLAQNLQQIAEEGTEQLAKSSQVSSALMEKLSESLKTNQPFRIEFDSDLSVVMKVNKDGSIMANFIPGDKAVEQYLKNNISLLKQRFDEEDLSYSDLSYSNSREQSKEKQKEKHRENN